VWPKDSSFDSLRAWPQDFSAQVLQRVWQAFDLLQDGVFRYVTNWDDLEHLERSLTDLHYDKIVELQSGEEPFLPTREVPDFESRKSASAMPRSNDFGFKLRGGDLSLVWPLEAKVISSLQRVADYLNDLNTKYLTCKSSPFSHEAGLIGYLLNVDSESVLSRIGQDIKFQPNRSEIFSNRLHCFSDHERKVPLGKPYPARLRCHHLLMAIAGQEPSRG
jgi:hypothetical protein